MFNNSPDAKKYQRILKKLNKDIAKAKDEIDEKRTVSRSIVLGRIICFMRKRHQAENNDPLSLNQILIGTNQQYVGWDVRYWLYTAGVPDHQKITAVQNGIRFIYKPTYNIKNRSELLQLLKEAYDKNKGGILLDDIIESLPNAEKILEDNPLDYVTLMRLEDRKKMLFFEKKAKDMRQMRKDIKICSSYVPIRNANEKKSIFDYDLPSSCGQLTHYAAGGGTKSVSNAVKKTKLFDSANNVFEDYDNFSDSIKSSSGDGIDDTSSESSYKEGYFTESCTSEEFYTPIGSVKSFVVAASGCADTSNTMEKTVNSLLEAGDCLLVSKVEGVETVAREPQIATHSNESEIWEENDLDLSL